MVKLEEVPDEELVINQDGPVGGEDDWDTDSGMIHNPFPMQGNLTHQPLLTSSPLQTQTSATPPPLHRMT
jgi:hypothetical protein